MLGRGLRLRSGRRIAAVFQEGRRFTGRTVTLVCRERGDGGAPQIAITAARRLGHKPARNRARRRLRAAVRAWVSGIRPGFDLVFIARPQALTAAFAVLLEDVRGLLESAGVWNGGGEGQ